MPISGCHDLPLATFNPGQVPAATPAPGPNAYGSATQVRPLSLLVCPSAHTH